MKERWDILMIICAICNSFFIPLELHFNFNNLFSSYGYLVADNLIDLLFLIDIIIMFF